MADIKRRDALALIGSAATLAAPNATHASDTEPVAFLHGVASGDPSADGAVIWTRATGDGGEIVLEWHVASAADAKPVKSGRVTARFSADHTAKVEVGGLQPGRDYWFWFTTAKGDRSPTGRFRTLALGRLDDLVIAAVSCQLYPGGFFNAYADLAARPRLDAVVHLGDYIYEYGKDGYGAAIGHKLNRLPDPPHEILTLSDYRLRHAQVKADPDMQAAHARAAFICVWDDHEVANDSWIGGAENHDTATEGDWSRRKAAAMQAYFEWMPIRDSRRGLKQEAIYRSFEFGDLATLVMVESRLLARSKQVEASADMPGAQAYAAMLEEMARPGREMLGAGQQRWIEQTLTRSVRAGKPWQLLGNQVVMAKVAGPDPAKLNDGGKFAAMLAKVPAEYQQRMQQATAGYAAGVPFNTDGWDGYPAARERLYAAMRRAGSRPIVLSGDSHAAWSNDLHDDAGTLVASEFGATAITSPSYGSLFPGLGAMLARMNSEVAFCDQDNKGYTLLTIDRQRVIAEHIAVSSVLSKTYSRRVAARCHVTATNRQKIVVEQDF